MTPIIFVHYGYSWYLDLVFECARKFNPDIPIILLGENMNVDLCKKYKITYYPFKDYHNQRSREFIWNYKHIGSTKGTDQRKHCICFMRWSFIENFMEKNGVNSAWYFDSDTLICQNLEKIYPWYLNKGYWLSNRISGANTLIVNRRLLGHLNDTIFQKMSDPVFLDGKRRAYEKRLKEGKNYNICDMSCIGEFSKNSMVGDLTDIVQGSTFDPNINIHTADQRINEYYPYYFEMENYKNYHRSIKKIYYKEEIPGVVYPYCSVFNKDEPYPGTKPIRMFTLNMSWLPRDLFLRIHNRIVKK